MAELESLPLFHRIEGQKVLVLGEGQAAEPKRRLVQRAGGIIVEDMQRAIDEGVRIAFVAHEDAKACEVAAINLRCAGMLVNVVDRPELCDFTTPSLLDRKPVLIAVGTGGASAGLAKHLRLRLERILPDQLGGLADALFAFRARLRDRFPDAAERRRALDAALREGGALDVLDPASHERVGDWLEAADTPRPPTLAEFTIRSDDPEDLTVKQARMLGEADTVCADPGIAPAILARVRADARRITCDRLSCRSSERPRCAFPDGGADPAGMTVILRHGTGANPG
ncbi:uroporphyrin-III C-methyltransferase / precorrin-2 dehydrogenase / sirohydrochlorin ferrochelatase [Erythrobacter litoralis]|uniref:precorrin-2 dehydrogenase n=1 Tax=Erythrobacter litoralis TaxID=39960 RepID=A0A074M352_9SPHN|nr:bifunctional precorrin-2 dehydrogenase/sirohydrochlorin ferrochelatase [Erythrobacter litoralis]AOL24263.1 uroporphyrin-III C-methyltransferase / precorrin-2 dehydrogenase / sirohydrochlorin ferrochelatase [Erythrobacter litoralis]KEO88961.1 siroheme synthase [Erythrobacter litoralis]